MTDESHVTHTVATDGDLEIEHSPEQERYRLLLTGDSVSDEDRPIMVGYLDYVPEVESVVLTHTVVPEQYGGRGYAGVLVKAVLDDIRASGKDVVSVCSFVTDYVRKHPEYADLVVESGQ